MIQRIPKCTRLHGGVGMAYSGRNHLDQHLSFDRLLELDILDRQRFVSLLEDRGLVRLWKIGSHNVYSYSLLDLKRKTSASYDREVQFTWLFIRKNVQHYGEEEENEKITNADFKRAH